MSRKKPEKVTSFTNTTLLFKVKSKNRFKKSAIVIKNYFEYVGQADFRRNSKLILWHPSIRDELFP